MSRMSDLACDRDAGAGGICRRFTPMVDGDYLRHIEPRDGGGPSTIEGYAAVFDVVTDLGWFKEVIMRGAFTESLRNKDDVRGLFNHNPDAILGRTTAGTLQLREETRGLWYGITLPDTQVARDLAVSLKRGDITGSSFAFQVLDEEPQTIDGAEVRAITRAKLFDVSPVTYPAYEETTAEARGADLVYLEALRRRRAAVLDAENLAADCATTNLTRNR